MQRGSAGPSSARSICTTGDVFRNAAVYNVPPAFAATQHVPFRPHPGSAHAEIVRTKRAVQFEDARALRAYRDGDPRVVVSVDLGGAHTFSSSLGCSCGSTTNVDANRHEQHVAVRGSRISSACGEGPAGTRLIHQRGLLYPHPAELLDHDPH